MTIHRATGVAHASSLTRNPARSRLLASSARRLVGPPSPAASAYASSRASPESSGLMCARSRTEAYANEPRPFSSTARTAYAHMARGTSSSLTELAASSANTCSSVICRRSHRLPASRPLVRPGPRLRFPAPADGPPASDAGSLSLPLSLALSLPSPLPLSLLLPLPDPRRELAGLPLPLPPELEPDDSVPSDDDDGESDALGSHVDADDESDDKPEPEPEPEPEPGPEPEKVAASRLRMQARRPPGRPPPGGGEADDS